MTSNRLLVIDDAPASSATIGRIARGCGYDTIITTDIDDCRSRIPSWNPTVIVLDLNMPEMDGNQLMVWLADQGCQAHILIISGREQESLREAEANGRALGLNITGSLQKPLRVDKLRTVFREIYDAAGMLSIRDLSKALSNKEFRLVYQPQIDLSNEAIIGFEALARWEHPLRGDIPPTMFIPVLEANEIMNDFTSQVFDLALDDMNRWNHGANFRVAMNVSAANFRSPGLDEILLAKCINKGIDLKRITIEITESVAMTETAHVSACLQRLHEYGARVSIDDFGTGHSSLVTLHQLPFSELKIDQSFVADCVTNRQSGVLVPAMVELAHNMDMKVVAEGVESQEMMRALRGWGCDIAQGFFISQPIPSQDVIPWLQQRLSQAGSA